jgi:hypothetical protein
VQHPVTRLPRLCTALLCRFRDAVKRAESWHKLPIVHELLPFYDYVYFASSDVYPAVPAHSLGPSIVALAADPVKLILFSEGGAVANGAASFAGPWLVKRGSDTQALLRDWYDLPLTVMSNTLPASCQADAVAALATDRPWEAGAWTAECGFAHKHRVNAVVAVKDSMTAYHGSYIRQADMITETDWSQDYFDRSVGAQKGVATGVAGLSLWCRTNADCHGHNRTTASIRSLLSFPTLLWEDIINNPNSPTIWVTSKRYQ